MMSFHSSTRWSRRAIRLLLAALLVAATANPGRAQEATAVIAEISAAAAVTISINSTNGPATVKPAEASQPAKIDPAAGPSAKDTNAAVIVKSPETVPPAKTNPTVTNVSMETVKLIADRNIFNQSRMPGRRSQSTESRGPSRPPTRVEAVALVGTMIYEKGNFAFFDGSGSQFRKTVKSGDSIGNYKLTEVGPNQVRLVGDNQEWTLKVGQELRRENDGEWKLGSRSSLPASSESASSSPNSSSESAAAASESNGSDPAPAADAAPISDVLRRMLEARAKEEGR